MRYTINEGIEKSENKLKKSIAIGIASILMLIAASVPAFAAGNAKSGFTTGDCVSDFFYGNEPNMANGAPGGPAEQEPGTQAGNVLPSQSPGPFVTNSSTGEVSKGSSIGDYQQQGLNLPKFCHEATS